MALFSPASVDSPAAEDGCRPQRVLVVDEHDLIQAGLRSVLVDAPWVAACFVAGDLEVAMQIVRRHQPHLVFVSVSLVGRAGPQLCHWLKEWMPHIKVVLMFGEGRIPAALAVSLGAVATLSKHMPRAAMLEAMKRVAEGGRIFPRGSAAPAELQPRTRLSRRELDVLQHVASGLSNPETALSLRLSRNTVKQHTRAVYRKLGVRNRAEAASRAQDLGLLTWNGSRDERLRVG